MSAPTQAFDQELDVLVVGSGGGGVVAALTAKAAGLDVLLVEKTDLFGGTTALSGGGIWIPNAPSIRRAGHYDTPESVLEYLRSITAGRVSTERLERFVEEGPKMLEFLESQSRHIKFNWKPKYPDYHPNNPGGSAIGRSIEPVHIDLRDLGELATSMRHRPLAPMWIRSSDLHAFLSLRRSWRGKVMFARLTGRMVRSRLTGARIVASGAALVARLRLAVRDNDVALWLETPLTSLITDESGAVIGAELERDGKPYRVRARGGVILATGGFDHNLEMRTRYQPTVREDWSLGNPAALGDGIVAGEAVGAGVDLMDDAWWMPAIPFGPGRVWPLLAERQIPGQFVVNGAGERYTNEAAPYTDFVHDMIAGERGGVTHIPSWLIIDDKAWRTYMFAGHLPLPSVPAPQPTGRALPQAWLDAGVVETAGTWVELAEKIGVPGDALVRTAERFNAFARQARDDDFHRGESAYDNYYGDPRYPNPNLGEISVPPYYAFKLVPADLGTKGGLLTDENARVLRADGRVITGLFATGNTSAAVMGDSYAGPGATIGPAMTFGYVAANTIAEQLRSDIGGAPEPTLAAATD
jgi:3-oxosteroid 1-dehydrogenase